MLSKFYMTIENIHVPYIIFNKQLKKYLKQHVFSWES